MSTLRKAGRRCAKKGRSSRFAGLPNAVVREFIKAKLELGLAKAELALAEQLYSWLFDDWEPEFPGASPPPAVTNAQAKLDAAQNKFEEKEAALTAAQTNYRRARRHLSRH